MSSTRANTSTVLQRLRAARLRPTIARIGVLQVIEAAGTGRVSAEDVFRQMLLRGTRVSIGTVYRCIHQFEDSGLLLREWGANRRALYRVKPVGFDTHALRLLCRTCGRGIALTDTALHERLEHLASLQGICIANQAVTIAVDCASCANRKSGVRSNSLPARARASATVIEPGGSMAVG